MHATFCKTKQSKHLYMDIFYFISTKCIPAAFRQRTFHFFQHTSKTISYTMNKAITSHVLVQGNSYIFFSVCLSISLAICLFTVCLSVQLSICLFPVCLSVYLYSLLFCGSIYLSVYFTSCLTFLFVYLSVYLYAYLF